MTRALHRLTRVACPPADRPWVDALFAEAGAIEGRARLLWLLGAAGVLTDVYARRTVLVLTPALLFCLLATAVFGWLAVIEYEGFLTEDDWYGPIAALFAAALIAVAVFNLKRPSRSFRR